MLIHIIDLGINNLNSVIKAFTTDHPNNRIHIVGSSGSNSASEQSDLMILPGLGHFGAAARILDDCGIPEYIDTQLAGGASLVGICLGMQLLGTDSEEDKTSRGLNLIPGTSKLLPRVDRERIPNVGWREVNPSDPSQWPSLANNLDFYFTHSYAFQTTTNTDILASSPYGEEEFVSAVQRGRVMGFQFHPEKSGKAGKKLILDILSKVK